MFITRKIEWKSRITKINANLKFVFIHAFFCAQNLSERFVRGFASDR